MKHISLLLLTCLAITTSGPASAKGVAPRVRVTPGESLGPIHLGMARAQIAALGLPTGPNYPTEPPTMTSVGLYHVDYDAEGKVRSASIELRKAARGLVVGQQTISRDATITEAAAAFSGCEQSSATGGGTICEHGSISLGDGDGGKDAIVIVEVSRTKQ